MKQRLALALVFAGLILGLAATVFIPSLSASRNASGTYTLPAGNPVVTGTTISSTWANNTLSDLSTEMTDSLDRSGKGGMLSSLSLINGTVGTPALNFTSQTNTGLYRAAASDLRCSLNGGDAQRWTTTANFLYGPGAAPSLTGTYAGVGAIGAGAGSSSSTNLTNVGTVGVGGTSSASGLVGIGGTPNGNGGQGTGTGTGNGLSGTGGATSGAGLFGTGGAPNGNGVTAQGTGTGNGVVGTGGGTSATGVTGNGGTPNGVGVAGTGAGSGTGGFFTGGSSSGIGVSATGVGTGVGINATGGATNAAGVTGTGGGSGAGGTFANGTAATGGTRQDAVTLTNGDLNMSGVTYPTSTTAIANRLTPKNITKVWARLHTDGAGNCIIDDAFDVTSCSVAAGGNTTITFANSFANTNFATLASDEVVLRLVITVSKTTSTAVLQFFTTAAAQVDCTASICSGSFLAMGAQ